MVVVWVIAVQVKRLACALAHSEKRQLPQAANLAQHVRQLLSRRSINRIATQRQQVIRSIKCINVLLEPCFGDSSNDGLMRISQQRLIHDGRHGLRHATVCLTSPMNPLASKLRSTNTAVCCLMLITLDARVP